MKAVLLAGCLAVVPHMALALSCVPYAVQDAFVSARDAQERYVVVRGQLDFDPAQVPPRDMTKQNPDTIIVSGHLRGKSLSNAGFTYRYDKPVTVTLSCVGPWCAGAEPGSEVLAFVALGADGDGVIANHPCGGYLFTRPTAQMLRDVRQCFAGKECVGSR